MTALDPDHGKQRSDREELQRLGTFFVSVAPEEPDYGVDEAIPAHHFVVRPLLQAAVAGRIYGATRDAKIAKLLAGASARRRGWLDLDLSQELLRGRERLWNAQSWQRGAIVLVCRGEALDLPQIFAYCEPPEVWSSKYQIAKGSPRSAIAFCERSAAGSQIAFLFSASNGIQWMDVFPAADRLAEIYDLARRHGRRFRRFVEHNPGARRELVVDRPPYSNGKGQWP